MVYFAAAVGFMVCVVAVKLCSQIDNRLIRYGAMLPGVIAGLYVAVTMAGSAEDAIRAAICIAGLAVAYPLIFNSDETAS